jgi:hypothetical protein
VVDREPNRPIPDLHDRRSAPNNQLRFQCHGHEQYWNWANLIDLDCQHVYLIRPISRSFLTTLPMRPVYGTAVERSLILPSESLTISIVTGSAGSN